MSPLHACANSGIMSFFGCSCEIVVYLPSANGAVRTVLSADHRRHTGIQHRLQLAGMPGCAAEDHPHAFPFTRCPGQGMSVMDSAILSNYKSSMSIARLDCPTGWVWHVIRDTGEAIEVLALPLDTAQAFMDDHSLFKSAGLLFGLLWLRTEKALAGAT